MTTADKPTPTAHDHGNCALCDQIEAELAALHERLEDNFAWVDGERVVVEPGSIPDGIACRDETITLLRKENGMQHTMLVAANERLERQRAKSKNQRSELRRLNKYLGPYWSGFTKGMGMEAECRLRGIMNAAFGHEKVRAAEHAAIELEKKP